MISFFNILKTILTERVSFRALLAGSESGRKQRGRQDVNARSIRVASLDGNEAWTFSYKSNPSTTGKRWHGYIQFLKGTISQEDNAEDLDCRVSCDCPDYRFRYAYNNHKAEAGDLGLNNGRPPRPRSQGGVGDYGVGLCKHLCALTDFLKTNITPDAPEPEDPPPVTKKKPVTKPLRPAVAPQTSNAPDPNTDSYTDSRAGSDTLQESHFPLYGRIDQFVKTHPEFDVIYDD